MGVGRGWRKRAQYAAYVDLVSRGVGVAEAAARVGVGRSTGWRWRQPASPVLPVSPAQAGSGGSERERRVAGMVRAGWAARMERVAALEDLLAEAAELDELAERGRYLTLPEREIIALGRMAGLGVRAIARVLGRAPSTVSRELHRNTYLRTGPTGAVRPSSRRYGPWRAERLARARRRRPKLRKLATDPVLWAHVQDCLRKNWSPRQIAKTLPRVFPEQPERHLVHETIYQALYVQGRGELRRQLAAALRSGRAVRRPRRDPQARQSRFVEPMVMISDRPAEADDRAVPGHWEGDLIHRTKVPFVRQRRAIGRAADDQAGRAGTGCRVPTSTPSMAANTRWAAVRPSCWRLASMLVSSGRALVVSTSQLSKPMTAMSSGHRAAEVAGGVEDAAGDLVGAAEDRVDVRVLGQQQRGGVAAPVLGPLGEHDVADQLQARVGERARGRRRRGPAPRRSSGSPEMCAIRVRPQAHQVLDRDARGAVVVGGEREVGRVVGRRVGVHHRHRDARGRATGAGRSARPTTIRPSTRRLSSARRWCCSRMVSPRASQRNTLTCPAPKASSAPMRIGMHEPALEVAGEQADGAGAPGEQAAGQRVRAEGQPVGGVDHPLRGWPRRPGRGR